MDSHIIQFYEDDASYADLVLAFIGPGLRAGDSCILWATQTHRTFLEGRLKACGLVDNGAVVSAPGSYLTADIDETFATFMVNGWPDEKRFTDFAHELVDQAAKRGNGYVRILGEGAGVLFDRGERDAGIRLEQLWNQLLVTHRLSLCCSYPAWVLDVERHRAPIHATCREHTGVCIA
jgi:hypothetical protein